MKSLFRFASLALSGAVLLVTTGNALAQAYPSKPITLIVPFPAGGTTDALARTIGQKLSQAWGQPVIVDNRGGAGATIGANMVAKAAPDGYTLFMVPNVLVVNPSVPAKSVKELIDYAKANPGKLTYGSNGNGTAQHLIGTQFNLMAGTDIGHVPYKGSGPLTTDLLGGQVSMSFDTVTPVLPYIKTGKLKPLAVATAKRSTALPDVPTLSEAGLSGFDIASWYGVLVPAGTPKEIVAKLHDEIVKILNMPDVKKRFAELGAEPVGDTPEQMAAQIKSETDKFAKLVKDANVKVE